jgi:ABC-type multidrug transport system ATPase subunit
VQNVITVLGLNSCRDVIVGNEFLRGISGGQKRRVTAGEFFVTPTPVKFMDSISNGLDSATTLDMIRAVRTAVDCIGGTCVISLLQVRRQTESRVLCGVTGMPQPPPEVFRLFDEIILFREGQIIYHGRLSQ